MKTAHVVVVLLFTFFTSAALANEHTEPVFLIDADGKLMLSEAIVTEDSAYVSASVFGEALASENDLIASGNCNGGTCSTTGGTVLTCPSSGGPSCNSGQSCICSCQTNDDGSAYAVNRCIRKVSVEPIPFGTDPVVIEP